MENKLSTENYKGVRDFYPEDFKILEYIFDVWKKTVKSFGYSEYNASLLEPSELYKAKTGEEIVNEQTYTFKDRGEREVTLRPEMTPTLARMISARKRALSFPLRWFSIPNLFRYEKTQRGRLREHWQLNVDVFGIESIWAEVEIITVAHNIMRSFGIKEEQFEIKLNDRRIMDIVFKDFLKLDIENKYKFSKLIDKKNKISEEEFANGLKEICGSRFEECKKLLEAVDLNEFISFLPKEMQENEAFKNLKNLINILEKNGIRNIKFDQNLMRGFDYYTGTVFEVYDLNNKNKRSVFGGGRYDELLSIFGEEKIPAVGFGAGDVIMRDILETYNLLPKIVFQETICILPVDENAFDYSYGASKKIREKGINVSVDYSSRKLAEKMKQCNKRGVKYVIVIGEDEIKSNKVRIKQLDLSTENTERNAEIEIDIDSISKESFKI